MQRLKTRTQFQAVLAGNTIARTAHFALHRAALNTVVAVQGKLLPASIQPKVPFPIHAVWMGAMVPKRWAKRAVTRNAIKRQIYNLSFLREIEFAPAAHVVRLRSGFNRATYPSAASKALNAAVRAELNQLFAKAAIALPQITQPAQASRLSQAPLTSS